MLGNETTLAFVDRVPRDLVKKALETSLQTMSISTVIIKLPNKSNHSYHLTKDLNNTKIALIALNFKTTFVEM